MTNPKKYGKRQASIWFTEKEYAEVERKAEAIGMKFSEYVRFVCLNAKVKVEVREGGKQLG
jgi:hypothetical protein